MATSSETIGSGTAAGLLEFCDFLIERGVLSRSSVAPWKSAAKNVFAKVEGTDDFGEVNIRALDIDEYMGRFSNKTQGEYKPESLASYSSRFRKAMESYRAYLADPAGWRPKVRGGTSRPAASDTSDGAKTRRIPAQRGAGHEPVAREDAPRSEPVSAPSPKLVTYPFPLTSGEMGYVQLPQRITQADADRLTQFLKALVFEQPAELPTGASGGGPETTER